MQADLLIKNASQLLTMEGGLGIIEEGDIAVKDHKIIAIDQNIDADAKEVIDATGKVVTPGLVECHTHMVFSKTREQEYLQRLQGKSYLEILESGGGILNSVEHLRHTSKNTLLKNAVKSAKEFLEYGVTTIEVKTGYGLSYEAEKKMLEVIKELSDHTPQEIVSTFLGAHTIPSEHKDNPDEYVKEITEKMLPDFKELAENCDIFIEKNAFSYEQADTILGRAMNLGYKIKLHINQINQMKGVELAKKYNAMSVDHMDNVSDEEIETLKDTGAVVVLLPGAAYFLKEGHKAPARKFIEAGIPVALSTDFNPGSCPSTNLHLMMSMAAQTLDMQPDEIWQAVTINAAKAVGRKNEIGSLKVGKQADIVMWDMPNYLYPLYHFGKNFVEKTWCHSDIVMLLNNKL